MLLGWAEGAGGLVVWSGGSVPLNTGSGGRYAAIPNTNQVIETWGLRTQDLRISGSQDLREPECQMAGIGGEGGIRTLGTAKTVRRLSKPVQSTTLPPLRTLSERDEQRRAFMAKRLKCRPSSLLTDKKRILS